MPESASGSLPVALTIAGSDSGGGAGIQADLRTFASFGVWGTCAITAVTAQNTQGVQQVYPLSPVAVVEQIAAVAGDMPVRACKTGMLANVEIVQAVAQAVQRHQLPNLVVDPVLAAGTGEALLELGAVGALLEHLFPLALMVTPNLPEAAALTGHRLNTEEAIEAAARQLHARGPRYVVIKGGHREGEAVDVVFDGEHYHRLRGERIPVQDVHGTGCVFSAAVTAGLAWGQPPLQAIQEAKEFVEESLRQAVQVGGGRRVLLPGPR